MEGKWLPHFNADFLDEQVEVQIHKREGESGMVSRIEVYSIRPILRRQIVLELRVISDHGAMGTM